MAVFKIQEKKKKKTSVKAKKIIGIVLIALSCVFLFGLMTSILGFMNDFLLGSFGLFAYPLAILMFLIGVALLNNKRYTFSKKYTAFLVLSVLFLLCIIQMGIVGGKVHDDQTLTFGEHLVRSYELRWTAGGILLSLLTSSLTYLTGYVWAYVIFGVFFVVFLSLYIDSLVFLIKQKRLGKPVKVSLKDVSKNNSNEVNIVQKAQVKEKIEQETIEKNQQGISRQNPDLFERRIFEDIQEKPSRPSILTPPEVDLDKFFGRKKVDESLPSQNEIQKNVEQLRMDDLQNRSFSQDISEIISRENFANNLSNQSSDQVLSEVDNIINDVLEENNLKIQKDENQLANDLSEKTPSLDDLKNPSLQSEKFSQTNDRIISRDDRVFSRDDRVFSRDDRVFSRDELKMNNKPNFPRKSLDENSFIDEVEKIEKYHYQKPPIDLITTQSTDMSHLDCGVSKKSIQLENALEEFNVCAKVQDVVIGPAVTRYELEMPQGVSVKKIQNLSSDIALTLEANGGGVRIEAPVPGRSVVGIEVPNDNVAMVSLKDVISSEKFKKSSSPLTFAVGKDISGNILTGELDKMPHLLIAGTTGSGKSVMLNSIILSLIYKSSPDDVRLLLVDPKILEFVVYSGIPHMLTPKALDDVNKASNALTWAVEEMQNRYRLMADSGVRNIKEYNQSQNVVLGKKKKMPYIVIIIDEFSDFMMTSKKEVEDKIIKLGQKARASGIHMILATQNPTIESVTGGIKANIASRIAFKVASRVNSDVILGMNGAEKLLGKGDMLYATAEHQSSPKRVQGCFVSTEEVTNIVNYVTLNNEPNIDQTVLDAINRMPKNGASQEEKPMDPLLPEALKLCIESNQASVSMIQRKLGIGFPRAGKIIDQMNAFGYISEADGARSRKVFIDLEEFYKIFGDMYN